MSPPRWIPKEKIPRTVSKMLAETDKRRSNGGQAEKDKFELTEQIMLELINDDSFMAEVWRWRSHMRLNCRLRGFTKYGIRWDWIDDFSVMCDV
jgi:hypothetical protein